MMLSKLISIYSLFIHISSGCATIDLDGIPWRPLDVCWSERDNYGTVTYYKYICDNTGTLLKSVHYESECTDDQYTIPLSLTEGYTLNCEKKYDCSYGIIRVYNDTSSQCLHDTSIPYEEFMLVINECGYNVSEGESVQFRCDPDESTIYKSTDSYDTEELCDNTYQTLFIDTGCISSIGYIETKCVIPTEETDDALSTGVIVGIAIAGVAALLIGIGIAVYYYNNKKKKNDTKYSVVPKVEKPEEKQTKRIIVTTSQMQPSGQAPPPSFRPQTEQIQQRQPPPFQPQVQLTQQTQPPPVQIIKETQEAPPPAFQPQTMSTVFTTDGPSLSPSPPPTDKENVSLIQSNKSVISSWLQQNAQISEIDANKYTDIFIENGFEDLKLLKEITIDELVEIGISKLGHRKAIIKAIESDEIVLEPIC